MWIKKGRCSWPQYIPSWSTQGVLAFSPNKVGACQKMLKIWTIKTYSEWRSYVFSAALCRNTKKHFFACFIGGHDIQLRGIWPPQSSLKQYPNLNLGKSPFPGGFLKSTNRIQTLCNSTEGAPSDYLKIFMWCFRQESWIFVDQLGLHSSSTTEEESMNIHVGFMLACKT